MYRDVILMPHEEPIYSDSDEYSEKEVYFVTSIPGLNDWAKEGNLFEDHNFPIPIDRESCIVKIYNKIDLKPNQIIDVIGFIFLNPINLSSTNDTEISTHNPPLVPRLHTVKIIDLTKPTITNASIIISKAQNIRSDLHIIFTELLFGDTLVADYLICYLLSSIYGRTSDGLSLGRFSINVSNLPESKLNIFLKEFYNIIRLLVRKSHFLEVTANNLNRAPLVPKLDYEHNRLTNGELQLNNNTYLIINEPSLDINTLTTTGAENYKCLCNLILHQEIAYNCTYHPVKLKTDIPVLIFSDIKSRISASIYL
ncbi:mini-chromosome maintenance complex-binding protein-like isoform X2 [Solenopsis invicta]|uniref:mini-chromosome maintenance complex-binding protein-like isoform X2 n=1 Tax=Solenopsis invicta TaxID=13686 RepID=UPI00193E6CFB|nr:mini-chromosome maintenance complex-binding protein-like isoform X2 [Solenopsis invicta]